MSPTPAAGAIDRGPRGFGPARALACAAAIALLLIAAPAGCDDEESSPSATASASASAMKFSVDPALIGPMQRFEAFNVQIAPPAGWEPLPPEQVAAVASAAGMQMPVGAAAGNDQAPKPASGGETPLAAFATEPLAVFAGPQGAWLIVSAVAVPDPADFESALRSAREVLNSDRYTIEGIEVHQYLLRPPNLVNLKLLLSAPGREDSRRLQLDYVFGEQHYPQSGRLLESSLGSIRQIGQNGA